VDVNTPGTYTLRYNVQDPSHNAAVEVTRTVIVNNTAPVLSATHDAVNIGAPNSMQLNYGQAVDDIIISASDSVLHAPNLQILSTSYKKDTGPSVPTLPAGLTISGPTAPTANTCEWKVKGCIELGTDASTIGTYDVTVVVQDPCGATGTVTFRIKVNPSCVGAMSDIMYIGQTYVVTDSGGSAKVALSAGLKACSGDIRTARVTFGIRNGTTFTPIAGASNLRVGLVDPGVTSVGTATTIVSWNLGSSELSQAPEIAVKVEGNYYHNDPTDDQIVVIAKPVAQSSILGCGKVDNGNPSECRGFLKGADGKKTQVYFNLTYTKSGSNPQGKVTILVQSYKNPDGVSPDYTVKHCYLIKSTSIASLALTKTATASDPVAKASFTSERPANQHRWRRDLANHHLRWPGKSARRHWQQ
jgi:hypothetical protein